MVWYCECECDFICVLRVYACIFSGIFNCLSHFHSTRFVYFFFFFRQRYNLYIPGRAVHESKSRTTTSISLCTHLHSRKRICIQLSICMSETGPGLKFQRSLLVRSVFFVLCFWQSVTNEIYSNKSLISHIGFGFDLNQKKNCCGFVCSTKTNKNFKLTFVLLSIGADNLHNIEVHLCFCTCFKE